MNVKDVLILWKQVHQGKLKWKIFLFCENKSTKKSESERYSYLVKTSPTKKVKVNDFFMFNFSKGLGAPIGSLVLGRYLPWSSFVCWITKRKKVVSSNHPHPPNDHGLLAEIRKPKNSFFQPTILTLPIILHSEEMIWKARRLRKALGGGMRQTGFVLCIFYVFVRCIIEYCKWIGFSGVVAAAGLFGLEHVYPRLGEDHARWKKMIMTILTRGVGMVMMII